MKVDLTKLERDVIVDALDFNSLCRSGCYMEYKATENFCNIIDENGNYKCKFQQAINTIQKKLGVWDE